MEKISPMLGARFMESCGIARAGTCHDIRFHGHQPAAHTLAQIMHFKESPGVAYLTGLEKRIEEGSKHVPAEFLAALQPNCCPCKPQV